MILNLTTLFTQLIIDNMSTPAQKLKTVLDYLLDQNATLHEKYIEALSNDKADKEAIDKAQADKDLSVVALETTNSYLTEVKDELVKAKEEYVELQVKYDELLKQVSLTDKQKQEEIDELNVVLQSYIDKLPQDINAEAVSVINPIVVTEVEAVAPEVFETSVELVTEEVVNTSAEDILAEVDAEVVEE